MRKPPPTIEVVREHLEYDKSTGVFVCRATGRSLGARHSKGYVVVSFLGCSVYAHRLAWFYVTGEWPDAQIDHINGNPRDNSFGNLRVATGSENQSNVGAKRHNKLGVKGVTMVGARFRAEIRKDKRRHHIGYFPTAEAAAEAYAVAARRIHGKFANTGRGCE